MKFKHKLAYKLVWLANRLVRPPEKEMSYNYWPKFRPIDQSIKREGSFDGHKYACGAYSYEHLKSFSEQDGPNGPSARTTVKDFISTDGWKDIEDLDFKDVRREFAKIGLDMEER